MSDATITGGCACSAVRYTSTKTKPIFEVKCHCTQCQKATGSAFAAIMVLPKADITVEGDLTFHSYTAPNGNVVSHGFCPICGSPVHNKNTGYPDNIYIQAGSLDDTSQFNPVKAIFTDEAAHWDNLDPKLN